MSRLIDADAFDERVRIAVGFSEEDVSEDFKDGVSTTLLLLKTQPTVDAVEVVHCKDCKYYQKVYGGVPLGEVGHCICHSFETVPDWYCADGERREE